MDSTIQYPYWDALVKRYSMSPKYKPSLIEEYRNNTKSSIIFKDPWRHIERNLLIVANGDYCIDDVRLTGYTYWLIHVCPMKVRSTVMKIILQEEDPVWIIERIIEVIAPVIDDALSRIYDNPREVRITSLVVLWCYINNPGKPYNLHYLIIPYNLHTVITKHGVDLSLPVKDNLDILGIDPNVLEAIRLYMEYWKVKLDFKHISIDSTDRHINLLSALLYR